MLKKTLLATATTAVLLSPAAAFAQTGTGILNITGSIIDAPCSILPGDELQTINLGQVSKTLFSKATTAAPAYSPMVPVVIHLQNCTFATAAPLLNKVQITFPSVATSTAGKLPLTTGIDTGIYVQLLNSNGTTPVTMPGGTTQVDLPVGGTDHELRFFVRLGSDAAVTKFGQIGAQAAYVMSYK